MRIQRILIALLIMGASVASAGAQADYAARERVMSLSVGAMASGFRPDYGTSYPLFGPGAFVDFRITHWVQIEAEGRWLRFNKFLNESQDNYLIGPRVPIKRLWKFDTYGKVLIGDGKMNWPEGDVTTITSGSYTAIAPGFTAEYKLNRRWTLRALDFEYQFWPKWPGFPCNPGGGCGIPAQLAPINYEKALQPYGISVGIGYKIF